MQKIKRSKPRVWIVVLISVLLVVGLLCGGCVAYLTDCHHADWTAIGSFMPDGIQGETNGKYTVFAPEDPVAGLIFYPGAKVEHEAYIPLMQACAGEGVLCILVEMPLYFPLLWESAADGLQEKYPDIERWFIGGHSLGGYTAANYVAKHTDEYEGLLLLASYTDADLTGSGLDVLSVYGSKDKIMNRERYEAGRSRLPEGYAEIVIDGGCHAYFGMYKGQDGSEALAVTNAEQLQITADAIRMWIGK